MPLVVVHGYDGVELAVYGLVEHGIRRNGAGGVYAGASGVLDGGGYLRGFFVAEQAAVRRVRVERRHADARAGESPRSEALVRQLYLAQDVLARHVVAGDSQRAVGGEMHYAQRARHEHGRHVRRLGLALEYLHVSDVFVAGEAASLFVDGRCGYGGDFAGRRQLAGAEYPLHRRPPRRRRDFAVCDLGEVQIFEVENVNRPAQAADVCGVVNRSGVPVRADEVERRAHRRRAAHDERTALLINPIILKRLRDDFGSNAGGVAHGYGD